MQMHSTGRGEMAAAKVAYEEKCERTFIFCPLIHWVTLQSEGAIPYKLETSLSAAGLRGRWIRLNMTFFIPLFVKGK